MKILLILLLSINLCFAQSITPIKKGETSPMDGYVIDSQFEKDRRKEREQLRLEKRKNLVLSDLKVVQEERIGIYKRNAERAETEAQKARFKTVLYFVLGIALGMGAVKVGSKL